MTQCYVCHNASLRVPWRIAMCVMTHHYMCHDAFLRVPWRISMFARLIAMCVMCAMTQVKTVALEERQYSVFVGAAMLASLTTFQQMWIGAYVSVFASASVSVLCPAVDRCVYMYVYTCCVLHPPAPSTRCAWLHQIGRASCRERV